MEKIFKISLMLILLCLVITNSDAQSSSTGYSNGRSNGITVQYMIAANTIEGKSITEEKYTSGWELMYSRTLGNRIELGLPLRLGRINYEVANTLVPVDFYSVGVRIAFHIFEINEGYQFFNPYLLIPSVDAFFLNESYVDKKLDFHILTGGGVNFKLSDYFYIKLQTEYSISPSTDNKFLKYSAGLTLFI